MDSLTAAAAVPAFSKREASRIGHDGSLSGGRESKQPDSPPFYEQENLYKITNLRRTVLPSISAKLEGDFFMSDDGTWTCYRGSGFAVSVEFTMESSPLMEPLYLDRGVECTEIILSMAVSLETPVESSHGRLVELVLLDKFSADGSEVPMKDERRIVWSRRSLRHLPVWEQHENSKPDLNRFRHKWTADNRLQPSLPAHGDSYESCQQRFNGLQFETASFYTGDKTRPEYCQLTVRLWASVRNQSGFDPVWVNIATQCSHPIVVRDGEPRTFGAALPRNVFSRHYADQVLPFEEYLSTQYEENNDNRESVLSPQESEYISSVFPRLLYKHISHRVDLDNTNTRSRLTSCLPHLLKMYTLRLEDQMDKTGNSDFERAIEFLLEKRQ